MSISGISSSPQLAAMAQAQSPARPVAPGEAAQGPGFAERVQTALTQVADQQASANRAAQDYTMGRTDDLAGVMVEQQVASLGFQLTLQVRNKALGAYRDIMNMPV
jgi:flagellar hook-basal body complex protein FliE